MQLSVEHNLTDDQLRKALSGMAVASGIEQEVIETLAKSCACDNTPKEPRTRAMRILFHMMKQEYWQAARDIERYAGMISKGELEKAVSRPPFTADQMRQLALAINDRFAFVAVQIQSVEYRPAPDLLERWKQLGLIDHDITPETFMVSVPAEMRFVRNAFLMGKFIEAVEAGKTYQEVMQMALHAPILAPDLHAIAVAEQQTALYITDNAADLATKVGQLAIQKRNETIRQMAVDYHSRKLKRTTLDEDLKHEMGIETPDRYAENWSQFKSELHQTMEDKSRDWDRVAFYELTDAQKQGQAHKLMEDGDVDKLVYKMPLPTACAQCKFAYLEKDEKTPRLFKLSKLIQNGTNIGRKPRPVRGGKATTEGRADGAETMWPVSGLMHPWCACMGPYEFTGYEPWAKGLKKSNPNHEPTGGGDGEKGGQFAPRNIELDVADFEKVLWDLKTDQLDMRSPAKVMSHTPAILQQLGAENRQVDIDPLDIKKIILTWRVDGGKHGIPIETAKNIPKWISDPIMVFDSNTQPNSLVIVTEGEHESQPIYVIVQMEKRRGRHHLVNRISSTYQRPDLDVERWTKTGLLRCYDKKKGSEWLRSRGLQLPTDGTSLQSLSNKTLLFKSQHVKYVIVKP